jgi:hypothetical protein
MTNKSRENLGRIIKAVNDPAYRAKLLKDDRKHIADMIRAARIRVKANKAANDGIYVA